MYLYANKQNPVKMQLRRFPLFHPKLFKHNKSVILTNRHANFAFISHLNETLNFKNKVKVACQTHTQSLTETYRSTDWKEHLFFSLTGSYKHTHTHTQSHEGCLLLVLQEIDAKLCGPSSGVWHCYEWLAHCSVLFLAKTYIESLSDPTDCLIGHFKLYFIVTSYNFMSRQSMLCYVM